jgi:hypothetical protein
LTPATSVGEKPQLVLTDAINNDVRITKHADKCLIYDRPLPPSGLKWIDLAAWWQEIQAISDIKLARRSLGERLLESVRHTQSVPEFALFKTYYEVFTPLLDDELPALIPQVYLHYDPQTFEQRDGARILTRQRMDFLMLLAHNVRVVLEVDGKHHYAEGDTASPRLYAEMTQEDRTLRLRGYEVYRFGGAEFPDAQPPGNRQPIGPHSKTVITRFFSGLFRRHGISVPSIR